MLIHPWDAADGDQWRAVLAHHDFGTLISAGHVEGYPVVVPTHFWFDGQDVWLHLARPNPIWRAFDADPHAVLSVIADWAYVEAAWNADPPDESGSGTEPGRGVPTSYYTAVQLRGRVQILDDPDEKASVLTAQLAALEPPDSDRLPPSAHHPGDRRQLPGIRAVRLHVEDVLAKQKYGGNKSPAHRRRIADQLARRDAPGDRSAREHLLAGLDAPPRERTAGVGGTGPDLTTEDSPPSESGRRR